MTKLDAAALLTIFNDSIRIFRTDRLTSKSCGNKQFKLTNNLEALKRRGVKRVLSFGGLWSNHLHAFALGCRAQGLDPVAVVRGEESNKSALLNNAIAHGLVVRFVSRTDYQQRHNEAYVYALMRELACDAWLPEGGSNELAVKSCQEIALLTNRAAGKPPANIYLAVGTGATMAGIVNGAVRGQRVLGIPVVRDNRLSACIERWVIRDSAEWCLLPPAAPQQYGKVDQSLLEFVLEVFDSTGVILDPVYNAKALRSLLNHKPAIPAYSNGVFIHTGGLGGCLGFAEELLAIDPTIAGRLLAEVCLLLDLPGYAR